MPKLYYIAICAFGMIGAVPNSQRLGRPSSTLLGPWRPKTPPRRSTATTSHSNSAKAPQLMH